MPKVTKIAQLVCKDWNEKMASKGEYYDIIGSGYRCTLTKGRAKPKEFPEVIVYRKKKE